MRRSLAGKTVDTVVGSICHIEGASTIDPETSRTLALVTDSRVATGAMAVFAESALGWPSSHEMLTRSEQAARRN